MRPSTIMTIGPDEAMALLERNHGNRSVSDRVVSQYADDMRNGRWVESGNPINIGPDGRLLNGQHRLWALVEARATLRFHVVHEDDDDVFTTYDTGRQRSAATLVAMVAPGHKDTACAAGAARLAYLADITPADQSFDATKALSRSALAVHAGDMLGDPRFSWAVSVAGQVKTLRCGRSWYAAGLYLIAKVQPPIAYSGDEDAIAELAAFHHAIATGVGLDTGDPRLTLRNFMIRAGGPAGLREQRLYISAMVRCWNAWRNGKPLLTLQLGRYTTLPEALPVYPASDLSTPNNQ